MDIFTLIQQMREDGTVDAIARRVLAQFGRIGRVLIGAQLLPERPVEQNEYTEDRIEYRTIIANAGTRYSPVQLKQGAMVGSALVVLRESDLGNELTSREYDVLLSLLRGGSDIEAAARVARFLDNVNQGLIELNEKERWEALVNRLVERRGDNAYSEDVAISNPAGHVLDAALPWTDPTVDPFDEVNAAAQVLRDKGYTPRRIITRSAVGAAIAGNPNTKTRTGRVTIDNTGSLVGIGGRTTMDEINRQLQADELPPIETYDLRYRTSTGTVPFLQDGAMVIVGETDRTEELDLGDEMEILDGTLGYVGIGRPAGQARPGRVLVPTAYDTKPPRVENEGWQTSFPVIQDPEAFVSIRGITA